MAQARLVNDLLDLSRIAKGKLPLILNVVDLAAILEESVEAVRPAATLKEVAISVSRAPAPTIGDPARLQQVIVNLLTNAVQFTPAGGRIDAGVRVHGGEAVIRIDDTGAGIEPEFLPLVFEQFRQGEGGLSRKHGGLGLGLSVVQQLVELHDGEVTATSEGSGRGASFIVALPCETAMASRLELPRLALADVPILMVTDGLQPEIQDAMEAAAGGRVVKTLSATEAASRLPAVECDIVVVRAQMATAALESAVDSRVKHPALIAVEPTDRPVAVVRKVFRASALLLQ
jgi:hypothetical protein